MKIRALNSFMSCRGSSCQVAAGNKWRARGCPRQSQGTADGESAGQCLNSCLCGPAGDVSGSLEESQGHPKVLPKKLEVVKRVASEWHADALAT